MSSVFHRRGRTRMQRTRAGERGSAVIEFLGLGVLLAVPTAYLMMAMSLGQAGSLAAVTASDQAARVMAEHAGGNSDARSIAQQAVDDMMRGYGLAPSQAHLHLSCAGPCPGPGSRFTARVTIKVPLPFVPGNMAHLVSTGSETTMVSGAHE